MLDLEPPARELTNLLKGVIDSQLVAPTSCATYTVGDLLDHLMALTVAFRVAAAKSAEDLSAESPPGEASAAHLDPAWRELLPQRLDDLVAAWRHPSAWDGMAEAGGVQLPAEVMGAVAVDELVLHGWDLARGTGQPFAGDPASLQACHGFTTAMSQPGAEAGREGLFGPVAAVASDAPLLDRVLALSGRDPAWVGNSGA